MQLGSVLRTVDHGLLFRYLDCRDVSVGVAGLLESKMLGTAPAISLCFSPEMKITESMFTNSYSFNVFIRSMIYRSGSHGAVHHVLN